MSSEDLIGTELAGSGGAFRQEECPFAREYHRYVESVRVLSVEQAEGVKTQMKEYNRYYAQLARLGESAVAEFFPTETEIVNVIEQKSAEFGAARDKIPDVFLAACVAKMGDIGKKVTCSGVKAGQAWVEALSAFREWRASHMDGRDVDMGLLLQERSVNGTPDGLFGQVFNAWAKAAFPDRKISAIRTEILEELGQDDLTIRARGRIAAPWQAGFGP